MTAHFVRYDPGKREQGAPDPGEITLPPRSTQQSRIARMLVRVRDFGARLNARGRWIREFLHDGR